jgi:hypothetical protein
MRLSTGRLSLHQRLNLGFFGLEEVAARALSEAKRLKFLMLERKRV